MKPTISIIMGIYNCANTLEESLVSIETQTYADWELIMCDDGSKDDTLVVAKKFAEKYPNKTIILKNEKNLGLNATLNKCLAVAKGKYIARMDGDDISLPERFKIEVEFLDDHPEFALVSTNMSFFDDTGIYGCWVNPEKPQRIDFFRSSPCFCHAPCMIRKEAFLSVGGYTVEDRFLRCEDVNLWYKLYEAGYRGYNIQLPLYMMRDDRNAYKRRTFQNRINIIKTEFDGMKRLKCHGLEYRFFVKKALKNLILAFTPEVVYKALHKYKLNKKSEGVDAK